MRRTDQQSDFAFEKKHGGCRGISFEPFHRSRTLYVAIQTCRGDFRTEKHVNSCRCALQVFLNFAVLDLDAFNVKLPLHCAQCSYLWI